MRGLRNLSLTFNRAGRYDEASAVCDRLEEECGDDVTALSIRSAIYLNTERWQLAADAASRLNKLFASESFTAAFALFELGRLDDALAFFLHGSLNRPRAARILLRVKTTAPKSSDQVADHNTGVDLVRELGGFLSRQSRQSRRFFEGVARDSRVSSLLDEVEAVVERRHAQHSTGQREAFERMSEMHSPDFARRKAREFIDLISNTGSGRASRRVAARAVQKGQEK